MSFLASERTNSLKYSLGPSLKGQLLELYVSISSYSITGVREGSFLVEKTVQMNASTITAIYKLILNILQIFLSLYDNHMCYKIWFYFEIFFVLLIWPDLKPFFIPLLTQVKEKVIYLFDFAFLKIYNFNLCIIIETCLIFLNQLFFDNFLFLFIKILIFFCL